jgi:hypothetical protein
VIRLDFDAFDTLDDEEQPLPMRRIDVGVAQECPYRGEDLQIVVWLVQEARPHDLVVFEQFKQSDHVTYTVETDGGEAKAISIASGALARDRPGYQPWAVEVEDLGSDSLADPADLLAWDDVSYLVLLHSIALATRRSREGGGVRRGTISNPFMCMTGLGGRATANVAPHGSDGAEDPLAGAVRS